jgi:hypothetical protein
MGEFLDRSVRFIHLLKEILLCRVSVSSTNSRFGNGLYRRGRVSALLEDIPCLIKQAVTRLLRRLRTG